jgi:hypothetical protein
MAMLAQHSKLSRYDTRRNDYSSERLARTRPANGRRDLRRRTPQTRISARPAPRPGANLRAPSQVGRCQEVPKTMLAWLRRLLNSISNLRRDRPARRWRRW